ncbi:MAG: hypothetical protein ABR929_02725 [Roseiarcus sp.]|jgi:hypothetical protein
MTIGYQLTSPTLAANAQTIIRLGDGASIPPDQKNIDFQTFLAWLAAGNTPTAPPVPPAPVPTCALWQLQAVMVPAQWTAVTNAVAALANPAVSAFFAHGANVIPADSTTLLSLGASIGLSAAQVTALVAEAGAVSIP